MARLMSVAGWTAVALAGALAFGWLALSRGETVNAAWLLTAAVCTYLVAYRFYSRFIAAKVFALDASRATPSVRLNDGRDFVPTNRWIVFGHHFAAIAGPGPLVGPTLAAQFGFLPGAIWIVVGVVIGGAVQDMVILASSIRRNGKSLGQMAKEEIGPVAGYTALVAVLGIMVVLIAVLALVVVNALKASPWGVVTIALTIPIAILMGAYLRWIRPHRVLEASAIGLVLLVFALYAGKWVAADPTLAPIFTLDGRTLAWLVMGYGFAASVLPVWLLLAPRDYLSAFVKIGVVLALAIGILVTLPPIQMPAVTQFVDGTGPVRRDLRLPRACFIRYNTQAHRARNGCTASGLRGNADGVARCDHGARRCMRPYPGSLFRDQRTGGGDRNDRRVRCGGHPAMGLYGYSGRNR
jgi:carbon starvation protein